MGIILVYDITSAKTFENISKWLRNIDEVRGLHVVFIIIIIIIIIITTPLVMRRISAY